MVVHSSLHVIIIIFEKLTVLVFSVFFSILILVTHSLIFTLIIVLLLPLKLINFLFIFNNLLGLMRESIFLRFIPHSLRLQVLLHKPQPLFLLRNLIHSFLFHFIRMLIHICLVSVAQVIFISRVLVSLLDVQFLLLFSSHSNAFSLYLFDLT